MKGIALRSVFLLLIGLGSLIVLLSLFTMTLQPAGKWIYCSVYFKLFGFVSGSSPPEFCKPEEKPEIVEIKHGEKSAFSRELLSYIIACWKSAEIKGLYADHPCYEIHLKTVVDNVTERDVSRILIFEDGCKSIENYEYGCGEEDKIIWKIEGYINGTLSANDIADAINLATKPQSLSISPADIPTFNFKDTIDLRIFLSSQELMKKICDSKNCDSAKYNKTLEKVYFHISGKTYSYDINEVLSFLEKNNKIYRPINKQKLILVRYNGAKDAVEVVG